MHVTNLRNVTLFDACSRFSIPIEEARLALTGLGILVTAKNGYALREELDPADLDRLREAHRGWLAAHPRPVEEKPAAQYIDLRAADIGGICRAFGIGPDAVRALALELGIVLLAGGRLRAEDADRLEAGLNARRRPRPTPLGVQEPVVRSTGDRERFPATPPATAPKPARKGRA